MGLFQTIQKDYTDVLVNFKLLSTLLLLFYYYLIFYDLSYLVKHISLLATFWSLYLDHGNCKIYSNGVFEIIVSALGVPSASDLETILKFRLVLVGYLVPLMMEQFGSLIFRCFICYLKYRGFSSTSFHKKAENDSSFENNSSFIDPALLDNSNFKIETVLKPE